MTIAPKAETRLFLDVRRNKHVCPLPFTGGAAASSAQTTVANMQDLAEAACRKCVAMFFDISIVAKNGFEAAA